MFKLQFDWYISIQENLMPNSPEDRVFCSQPSLVREVREEF